MSELQDCLEFVNSELEENAARIQALKAELFEAKKVRIILKQEYDSVRAEMNS